MESRDLSKFPDISFAEVESFAQKASGCLDANVPGKRTSFSLNLATFMRRNVSKIWDILTSKCANISLNKVVRCY